MKLLLITQKVDRDDTVLGFVHGWLVALAPRFERVSVVCLEEGHHALPANVCVYSLGKKQEKVISHWSLVIFKRLIYTARFFRFLWQLRHSYDGVFVHMNPEYVVLAGLLWRMTGKRIVLWYNHIYGGLFTRIAGMFAHRICVVSLFSFFASWRKAAQIPAGIDTDLFRLGTLAPSRTVLSLGRISPVKNLEVLVAAVRILWRRGVQFVLSIYGDPTPVDRAYAHALALNANDLVAVGVVRFVSGVPHNETARVYAGARVFVNCTNSGSLDKTTLEAMACGVLPLVSNRAYATMLPPAIAERCMFREGDTAHCALQLAHLLALDEARATSMRVMLRDVVLAQHSLGALVDRIVRLYE